MTCRRLNKNCSFFCMKRQQQEENDRQAELTRETLRVGSRREYPQVGGGSPQDY